MMLAVAVVVVSSGAIGWASLGQLGEQGITGLVRYHLLVTEPVVPIAGGAGLDWARLTALAAAACLAVALLLLQAVHGSRRRS